jgi:hypothetical protein
MAVPENIEIIMALEALSVAEDGEKDLLNAYLINNPEGWELMSSYYRVSALIVASLARERARDNLRSQIMRRITDAQG